MLPGPAEALWYREHQPSPSSRGVNVPRSSSRSPVSPTNPAVLPVNTMPHCLNHLPRCRPIRCPRPIGALVRSTPRSTSVRMPAVPIEVAQFIAVCRRSKMGSMGPRRPRRGVRLCRRCALQRRGETPRLRQILRSTKCDKLSDPSNCSR